MAATESPRILLGPGDVPLPLGYPDWDGRWPEAVVAWHMGTAPEEPRRYVPERTCRVVREEGGFPCCSACGSLEVVDDVAGVYDYCPRCGARVEEDGHADR